MIMRLLKLDPRPPAYDSVVEATLDEEAAKVVDDAVEMATWRALAPERPATIPRIVFVDGVQQLEARVSAEGEGWPTPGIVASIAAGAICPSNGAAVLHAQVERRIILANGRQPSPLSIQAQSGVFHYRPTASAGDDPNGLQMTLGDLRARLETEVVREILDEGADLVVVDGRLPPVTASNAVGLIKTPHRLPLTSDEHVDVLMRLKTGERSPVFTRQRSSRKFYSWFICLRTPAAGDLASSGLALLEMDDTTPAAEAFRVADITASVLPSYASTPVRDARAPQNLLPVGQLERQLRHRLGDPELRLRLLRRAFAKEQPAWQD
ncbi:MAG: hypothetical protein M3P30_13895 [Chloroflexota bacterium]|nr:hypothetical protein [Chloroflexota bacterium]